MTILAHYATRICVLAAALCLAAASLGSDGDNESAMVKPAADLTNGLVLHYTFDNVEGTAVRDDSGKGHVGKLEGAKIVPDGARGNVCRVGKNTGYVRVPPSPEWSFGTNPFTITLWVNPDSVPREQHMFIGCNREQGKQEKWGFYVARGRVGFHINSQAFGIMSIASTPWNCTTTAWSHLAVTRANNRYTVYINGKHAQSGTNSASIPVMDAPLTIGQVGGFAVNGLLDDVRVYNRALSAREIAAIAQAAVEAPAVTASAVPADAPATNLAAGLVLHYTFDDGTAKDESGNGLDGVLNGAKIVPKGKVENACRVGEKAGFMSVQPAPPSPSGTNDFSIALWVNLDEAPHKEFVFLGCSKGSGKTEKWCLEMLAGKIDFHINGPGCGKCRIASFWWSCREKTWHHFAMTRAANQFTLYIDGKSVRKDTNRTPVPTIEGGLLLGQMEGLYMNGMLDDVRIYKRALSSEEVALLAQ